VLNWIFTPSSAAANFGFVLNELSDSAQNALLRDFTSFFVATFVFSIFGAITLNPVWFFSAGIVYYGAALFNLMAVYVHGTAYNQIYIGEIVLGTWPTLLALTIIYKNKSSN
jgi:thiamine transporter ThiT